MTRLPGLSIVALLLSCQGGDHQATVRATAADSTPPAIEPADAAPTEVDGIPIVIMLADGEHPDGAALDADHVYLVTGGVSRVAKRGGPLERLVEVGTMAESERPLVNTPAEREAVDRVAAGDPAAKRRLETATLLELEKNYRQPVVAGGFVYLWNMGTEAHKQKDATIERVAVAGGKPEIVAKDLPAEVDSFVVDEVAVYAMLHDGTLLAVPLAGGPPATLLPAAGHDEERFFIQDGDALVVAELTMDARRNFQHGLIERVPKTGGAPRPLVAKLGAMPVRLLADDQAIYWADEAGIWRLAKTRGKPALIAAHGKLKMWQCELFLDDTHIYVGDSSSRSAILRVAKSGGELVELRALPEYTTIIGVDATTVWMLDGRTLLALPKPAP